MKYEVISMPPFELMVIIKTLSYEGNIEILEYEPSKNTEPIITHLYHETFENFIYFIAHRSY